MVSVKCKLCKSSFRDKAELIDHLIEDHIKGEKEVEKKGEKGEKLPFLDKIQKDLEQEVDILRLEKMRDRLQQGLPAVEEQQPQEDFFDKLTKFETFRTGIKQEIIKDLEGSEGVEAQDPALPLIMKIIESSKKQQVGIPSIPSIQPTNIMSADKINPQSYSIDQLIAAVPDQIKKQIKAGKITKQQAAMWAKSQGTTKEQFQAVWLQLSSKGQKKRDRANLKA